MNKQASATTRTIALAGKRASLAMVTLNVAMHPHACATCRSYRRCPSLILARQDKERLITELAHLEAGSATQ